MNAAGHLPDETVDRLIELLDHDDEHMRVTAAMGARLMRERAAPVIPALIMRLGDEQNLDIVGEMIAALAAIGEAAIPSLTTVILEGDAFRSEYAMRALVAIGGDAARSLAELLPKTDNPRVQKTLVGVLVGMGRRATPAIPVMADILNHTDDDELAIHVAIGIAACGPSAGAALDALLRCIAMRGCDDPVGVWAERALWAMKETAMPRLREVIKEISGLHRKNLERALAGMDASFGSDLGPLLHYDMDDLLALFVDIGTVLEERGLASWRTMEEVLREKKSQGLLTPGYKGVSERFIATRVKKLGKHLRKRLTTHGGNQKGELTPDGRVLLKEARDYLRKKSLQQMRDTKESH
jgi:hypothetical protein